MPIQLSGQALSRLAAICGMLLLPVDMCWAQSCPIAGQKDEVRVTLYFGRDRTGQRPVSNIEWRKFAGADLTRAFPDGFTETDGTGQWRDPATGHIVREASKIVDVVTDGADLPGRIAALTEDYEKEFQQKSVGVVTAPVCAEF